MAQGSGQRGQQQVVDSGAVGGRRLLQQALGLAAVQLGVNKDGLLFSARCLRRGTGQVGVGALQLLLPERSLGAALRATGELLQAFAPVAHGMGLGR
ncbi:hypothetical protein D3C81_1729350 [compost metagenome]